MRLLDLSDPWPYYRCYDEFYESLAKSKVKTLIDDIYQSTGNQIMI